MAEPQVTLADIVDPGVMADAIARKRVMVSEDGEGLRILNYAPDVQYDGDWTEATRVARGLILDEDDNVIARPFPKFFNFGQPEAGELPESPFDVWEKADGSLGIAYVHPRTGETRIATRGSLRSEQARWATRWWQTHCRNVEIPEGVTPLFEIIYPGNRIVVDYGDRAELVLLAVIDKRTGADAGGHLADPREVFDWPGAVVERHGQYDDIEELVAEVQRDDTRTNFEGYVVRYAGDGTGPNLRVKIKYPQYVAMHRILMHLDTRKVWELVAVGACVKAGMDAAEIGKALRLHVPDVELMLAGGADVVGNYRRELPDELYDWFDQTAEEFEKAIAEATPVYENEIARIRHLARQGGWDRRRVAEEIKASPLDTSLLFALWDEKPGWQARLWRNIEPEAGQTPSFNW